MADNPPAIINGLMREFAIRFRVWSAASGTVGPGDLLKLVTSAPSDSPLSDIAVDDMSHPPDAERLHLEVAREGGFYVVSYVPEPKTAEQQFEALKAVLEKNGWRVGL